MASASPSPATKKTAEQIGAYQDFRRFSVFLSIIVQRGSFDSMVLKTVGPQRKRLTFLPRYESKGAAIFASVDIHEIQDLHDHRIAIAGAHDDRFAAKATIRWGLHLARLAWARGAGGLGAIDRA